MNAERTCAAGVTRREGEDARSGCLDRGHGVVPGEVDAEVFAARSVGLVAARGDVGESGVLAGDGRDGDVVVRAMPVDGSACREGGGGDGGQWILEKGRGCRRSGCRGGEIGKRLDGGRRVVHPVAPR